MKQVLFIAYYYPPSGGAGVQRTLKFTRYLPEFGWQPVVLTVKGSIARLVDASLLDEIPSSVHVERTSAWLLPKQIPWRLRRFIAQWLLLVDEQLGWYPIAIRQAESMIQERALQVIYSTSAPFTDHLIGLHLAKNTGLPWLADFRDPWIGNFANRFPTRLHQALAQRLERRIVQTAYRIVVVSEPMRQTLLSRNPDLGADRVVTIHNGYDPDDLRGVPAMDFPSGQLNIVYSGSFYAQGRTPQEFLEALKQAVTSSDIPRQEIRVYLVGNIGQAAQDMVNELDLRDIVQMPGYLPHAQSLSYLLGADALLLIVGSGPGSEHVLTGKIFEYLAVRKPILALAPPGAAAEMIYKAKAGWVIHPHDPAGIRSQLVAIYNCWKHMDLSIEPDESVIASLDRRFLTGRLAIELDQISKGTDPMLSSDPSEQPEYQKEIERIRRVYQGSYRSRKEDRSYTWHPLNPVSIYYRQTLEKALVDLLRKLDLDLAGQRVLDLGCGEGGFLRYLLSLHASPGNLHGLDLMPHRIRAAVANSPSTMSYLVAEAGSLPYPDGCFDLVSQLTVFSSILDYGLRRRISGEMLRVLSPGGLVLWYDLRITGKSTTSPVTHQELLTLFPDCHLLAMRNLHAKRVSSVARRSSFLADLWDRIPAIPRTHLLAILQKSHTGGKSV